MDDCYHRQFTKLVLLAYVAISQNLYTNSKIEQIRAALLASLGQPLTSLFAICQPHTITFIMNVGHFLFFLVNRLSAIDYHWALAEVL